MSSLQVHIERESRERLAAQLATATQVRTRYGWYDILYHNPDSVAVTGDFGDFRIPHQTILETR